MSDTQIVRRGAGGELATQEFSRQQINVIKQTIMPRASDAELLAFVEYARRSGLDPFSRQIYAIPKKDQQGRPVGYEFMTGIDGLRLIAARSGEFEGVEIEWCDADGKWTDVWLDDKKVPSAARATVYKGGTSRRCRPVRWKEFARIGRNGIPIGNWGVMPAHMLGKCAEAQGLRTMFPKETAGLRVEIDDDGEVRPTQIRDPEAPASNPQKGELHRLADVFGWDEDEYRARLEAATGKRSSKDLTKGEIHALIDLWRAWEVALLEDGVAPPDENDDIVDGELVEDVEAGGVGPADPTDGAATAAVSHPASAKPQGVGTDQPPAPAPGKRSAEARVTPEADKAKRKSAGSGEISRPGAAKPPAADPSEPDVGSADIAVPSGSDDAGHPFEGNPDDDDPCAACGQPFGNRVHHATQGKLA